MDNLLGNGGILAVHATKTSDGRKREGIAEREPFASALARLGYESSAELPSGVVLGLVRVEAFERTEDVRDRIAELERSFGDFSDKRWAWRTTARIAFDRGIPVRGRQLAWSWQPPDALEAMVSSAVQMLRGQ